MLYMLLYRSSSCFILNKFQSNPTIVWVNRIGVSMSSNLPTLHTFPLSVTIVLENLPFFSMPVCFSKMLEERESTELSKYFNCRVKQRVGLLSAILLPRWQWPWDAYSNYSDCNLGHLICISDNIFKVFLDKLLIKMILHF